MHAFCFLFALCVVLAKTIRLDAATENELENEDEILLAHQTSKEFSQPQQPIVDWPPADWLFSEPPLSSRSEVLTIDGESYHAWEVEQVLKQAKVIPHDIQPRNWGFVKEDLEKEEINNWKDKWYQAKDKVYINPLYVESNPPILNASTQMVTSSDACSSLPCPLPCGGGYPGELLNRIRSSVGSPFSGSGSWKFERGGIWKMPSFVTPPDQDDWKGKTLFLISFSAGVTEESGVTATFNGDGTTVTINGPSNLAPALMATLNS